MFLTWGGPRGSIQPRFKEVPGLLPEPLHAGHAGISRENQRRANAAGGQARYSRVASRSAMLHSMPHISAKLLAPMLSLFLIPNSR